ncbi:MAG: NADH-quinone oxidoreductase subunit L [Halieaceae bacterium]|jgi:NADH-quinone oxidoreductase subunit L|nr:NADH-quinone oxidoreductase subunit L [Halieaceae bacterium]
MTDLLWLIPALPLASATLLIFGSQWWGPRSVAALGVGSVAAAGVCVLLTILSWQGAPLQQTLWTWIAVGELSAGVSFYIDGLTLVMLSVITGVGFLIHLYSAEFMSGDASYARYFAYLNLFVTAMLTLVMADNLLLLFLGWEGVGACSYLLVGFWHFDAANGAAARKAFVVTRVGDAAMALGLFLLFREFGTLDIQALGSAATAQWEVGDPTAVLATALLLGGAVGKSAQLPLHTWLPDAMAGPTPVSALIHAATMVTAGVYLIARTHELFLLAPPTLAAVAIIGLLTLLLAAFTALCQNDIKRILAWSTISQIGYMFLGLGVGAWSASIFHLMTHAFFKALLFLAAGAIIHCLHHEHDIRKMGGLRSRLPLVFLSFLIGAAALSALPLTSGFFSKDLIVLAAFEAPGIGPWLWAGAVLGAFLTALYSFRLVFVVFFGRADTLPDRQPGPAMAMPLSVLCVFSLAGGWLGIPVASVFPTAAEAHPALWVEAVSIGLPLLGVAMAYVLFLGRQWDASGLVESAPGQTLFRFWHAGWRVDGLYDWLWVKPFVGLTVLLKSEPVDRLYGAVVALCQFCHQQLSRSQSGRLRQYATVMAAGVIVLLGVVWRAAGG